MVWFYGNRHLSCSSSRVGWIWSFRPRSGKVPHPGWHRMCQPGGQALYFQGLLGRLHAAAVWKLSLGVFESILPHMSSCAAAVWQPIYEGPIFTHTFASVQVRGRPWSTKEASWADLLSGSPGPFSFPMQLKAVSDVIDPVPSRTAGLGLLGPPFHPVRSVAEHRRSHGRPGDVLQQPALRRCRSCPLRYPGDLQHVLQKC